MHHHTKNSYLILLLVLVFFATFFATYSIYGYYAATRAATPEFEKKLTQAIPKNKVEFEPDEVIVKFKRPVQELAQQTVNETNWDARPVAFKILNKANLSEKLKEVDRKYTINSIEKVFPQAERPEKELIKAKNKFADEIASGERVLDEEALLSNDISTIYLIRVKPGGGAVDDIVEELRTDPNVEYAEPNYLTQTTVVPNDPFYPLGPGFANQWYLENPGRGTVFRPDADIDASAAWNITAGRSSVVIAIIDSGVDYNHPDLGGGIGPSNKIIGGYDFRNKDNDPMDDFGHGTHIAGTVAAKYNNKIGVAGVCPNCKLLALKATNSSGSASVTNNALAIDYAVAHGADIINASWGSYSKLETVHAAMINAYAKGVLFVAAAGNNNTTDPFYPAAYPEAIAVANTSWDDTKSPNSNYNPATNKWIDISAPGSYILSTSLTGGTICTSPHESGTPRYGYCTGTSMAAPVVAGVAGLLLSEESTLSVGNLITQLKATSDNINALNPEFSGRLGSGRVNANNALTVAPSFCIDSDDGLNYNKRGYMTGVGTNNKNYDSCYLPSDSAVLNERHCGPNNEKWTSAYRCPLGCTLGRCLIQCVTSIASPNSIAITGSTNKNAAVVYKINPGSATMTWPAVSGSSGYFVEVDWQGNGWGNCDHPNYGDKCYEVTSPSVAHEFFFYGSVTKVKLYSKKNTGAFTCTPRTITIDTK